MKPLADRRSSGRASSQGGTVTGSVPVAFARIDINGPGANDQVVYADVNGNFSFTTTQNGAYVLTPSADMKAFNPPTIQVQVNPGNPNPTAVWNSNSFDLGHNFHQLRF